jgi:hypothetical protein
MHKDYGKTNTQGAQFIKNDLEFNCGIILLIYKIEKGRL